jgi:anaerobic magnesium-protoporphyrin IX monomethyl ester cyclase
MIDILLINPQEQGGFFERMPPLGLAHIASNLEKHNYSVNIVDLEVELKNIDYWLSTLQPRCVGISGTSHTRFESFRLARKVKKFNQEIKTIYGGVHATFTAHDALHNNKDIDYVVRGEGEQVVPDLLGTIKNEKELTHVPGITYRDKHGIVDNQPAQRIKNLDALPKPAYHLLAMNAYSLDMPFLHRRGISTITSRGCTAKCTFCSASRMFDHQITTHSPSYVLDEIALLFSTYGFEGVKIFDSTLTMKRDHIDAFCDEILRRGFVFPWECEIRVGTVDQELLVKMKKAGCYYVNFGIESASQRVLNLMRKGFAVEEAEKLLLLCRDVGLKTKVFFSFGHIGETMADVEKTFSFIDTHRQLITTVASGAGVRIYPGTYLETYARAHGLLPSDFKWSTSYDDKRLGAILQTPCVPVLIQPQLGFDELEKIALRIYSRRFSGWQGLKRGITKITDKDKLKKLWQLIKLHFRNTVKKPRS